MTLTEPTSEALERICCAGAGDKVAGVFLSDIYSMDALNQVLSGVIDVDGEEYGFIVESGNWNGTVVKAWGDPDDVGTYRPPERESPRFIPDDENRTVQEDFFFLQKTRKSEWFKGQEESYHYDRHVQPGAEIENYYRAWARNMHFRVGLLSEVHYRILEADIENITKLDDVSEETQEWVIRKRPDLIGKIPNLRRRLKEKYAHELGISKVDL